MLTPGRCIFTSHRGQKASSGETDRTRAPVAACVARRGGKRHNRGEPIRARCEFCDGETKCASNRSEHFGRRIFTTLDLGQILRGHTGPLGNIGQTFRPVDADLAKLSADNFAPQPFRFGPRTLG